MDPQQRLLLEVAWGSAGARESARHAPLGSRSVCRGMPGEACVRWLPICRRSWLGVAVALMKHRHQPPLIFLTSRPSVAVDTACSSSLVAIPPGLQTFGPRTVTWQSSAWCCPQRYFAVSDQVGALSPTGQSADAFDRRVCPRQGAGAEWCSSG